MPPVSTYYNQTIQPDEVFVAGFVARHDVLAALLRRLRAAAPKGCGPHHMLIGQRGMGKTSLLRRVSIAIGDEPDLAARYIPLMFREEQYNVLTLGDFWRNCGEALAEWAETAGQPDLAARLDAALLTNVWAEDATSFESFDAELSALDRRAVLLVDNLDLILDALPDDDHWTLRRHLQTERGPIVIGTATRALAQSTDRDAAFYEFFQPHHLAPLDERETEHCMRTLAHGRGSPGDPVIQVLDQQPERLKTLHALTGGNPRVLALIYRLLESAESDAAMADLELLLDQVTPYYKARVEEYQTAQQRAVIDAIALHWNPVTTGDLSKITNIASTTLSPLLIRLRKDGLIENVETSGAYAGHQLVERFFNIWYLMRHGTRRTKQKMRWLVEFFTSFYSPSELVEFSRRIGSGPFEISHNADYAFALREAVARQVARAPAGRIRLPMASVSEIDAPEEVSGWRAALDLSEALLQSWNDNDLLRHPLVLDEIVARFGAANEPELRVMAAIALISKGSLLRQAGDRIAEIAVYDDLLARFGDSEEPTLWSEVARALVNKGLALRGEGDNAAAIAAYDDLLARFGNSDKPTLQEHIASALFNKGFALGKEGNSSAQIAAYDDMVIRFGRAEELALREGVAQALNNKGLVLGRLGDTAAEIATFNDVVARFSNAEDITLLEQVTFALLNKGAALGLTGDTAAAIAAFDEVVTRYGDAESPALRTHAAMALAGKGIALNQAGDSAAAIIAYKGALSRSFDLPAHYVAVARIRLADLLFDICGDTARAETLYLEAASVEPLAANASLAWLHVLAGRVSNAIKIRGALDELPPHGRVPLDAAIDLAQDNFGSATNHLAAVFGDPLDTSAMDFSDDIERLLRLAERKGYGERLLAWFQETGTAERVAPIYAAFKAYVRGEATLRDVNPEVRGPAEVIYNRLDAPRRYQRETQSKPASAKRPRGRPRKGRS